MEEEVLRGYLGGNGDCVSLIMMMVVGGERKGFEMGEGSIV